MGCLRWKLFPPKNLKIKIRALEVRMLWFFPICSVSNICSNVASFPAKRLRKIRPSKCACATLFKNLSYIQTTLPIKWIFIYLLSSFFLSLLLADEVMSFWVVLQSKYSINHKSFIVQRSLICFKFSLIKGVKKNYSCIY